MQLTVKEYWEKTPCNIQSGEGVEGTKEWFIAVDRTRAYRHRFLESFAKYHEWSGKKVLEVGCGLGSDTFQFAFVGADITAVDLTRKAVELTGKHLDAYKLKGRVIHLNAEKMDVFGDNTFDLVWSFGVIHHMDNPQKAIDEIYRVLKPDGVFKGMLYHRLSTVGLVVYLKEVKRTGNPFISLKSAYAHSCESPNTKAYSYAELRRMFDKFQDVKLEPCLCAEELMIKDSRLRGKEWMLKWYPKSMASWILVEAKKA